jgi:hypothetical protein
MERLALQTVAKFEPLRVFCIEHLETPVERKRETMVSNKSPLFLLFKRKIVNPCLVQYWKTWRRDEYSKVFLVPDCVALLHRLWSSRHVLLCPAGSFSLGSSYLLIPVRWNPTEHKVRQGSLSSASTCVSLTCKFLSVHYLCHVPRFSQRSTQIVTDGIGVSFAHMTIPTMKFGWMETKEWRSCLSFFSIKIWKSIEEMKRWIDFYPPTRLLKYNSRPVIGGKKFPESTI